MITDNKFGLFVCEPYETYLQSDMMVIYKAYEFALEDSKKLDSMLTRNRLRFDNHKLNIELLE